MLKFLGFSKDPSTEPTKGDPADAITLLGFPSPPQCCSSLSPYGGKVETLLRLVDLPYEGMVADSTNSQHAPKGKLPVLRHGKNMVTDSSFITEYLINTYPTETARLIPADPKRRQIAHAVKRMIEEHFYWVLVYHNWKVDKHWYHYCPTVCAQIPALLYYIIPPFIRSVMVGQCNSQGMGRHSFEDAMKRGRQDWQAVADIMGDNEYLTGDTPTEADCSIFAFLDLGLNVPAADAPVRMMLNEFPNLVAFYNRIKVRLYDGKPSKLRQR